SACRTQGPVFSLRHSEPAPSDSAQLHRPAGFHPTDPPDELSTRIPKCPHAIPAAAFATVPATIHRIATAGGSAGRSRPIPRAGSSPLNLTADELCTAFHPVAP